MLRCRWTYRVLQMLCILAGMDQKYTYAVCFGGDDTSRAVFFFRVRCAPVPVHRQSGGHSCFMSMDLADPVSSGKYSGAFVFTAPVAEPTLVLFTVPLNGFTIVATATVVTSYSSSADCPDSAAPMCCGGVCVAMSCGGGGFTRDGAYDFVWDSVRPMTGKYTINYFQYQGDVGCVCMLNYWISSNDDICADNYIFSRLS